MNEERSKLSRTGGGGKKTSAVKQNFLPSEEIWVICRNKQSGSCYICTGVDQGMNSNRDREKI
jgi:hypothetical protein